MLCDPSALAWTAERCNSEGRAWERAWKPGVSAPLIPDCSHLLCQTRCFWPCSTKFERRCYELLRDAYVKARYSRQYRISDEQLAWLSTRIEPLQRLVRELCETRIAELAKAA